MDVSDPSSPFYCPWLNTISPMIMIHYACAMYMYTMGRVIRVITHGLSAYEELRMDCQTDKHSFTQQKCTGLAPLTPLNGV